MYKSYIPYLQYIRVKNCKNISGHLRLFCEHSSRTVYIAVLTHRRALWSEPSDE